MTDDKQINLQRALRQELECLRRAGLTHLPAQEPIAAALAAPERTARPPAPVHRQMERKTAATPVSTNPPVEPSSQPSPPMESKLVPSPKNTKSTSSTNDRSQLLDELAQRVAACTRCQELADTRKQTVFGVGNPNASIMFIGEAPGADEDRQGEPFVGRAGQLLNRIIEACQLKREDIYICNILRCRPPGNRTPSKVEAANCREYLDAQIQTVDPDYIVCWGSCAAQNLLDTTDSIGRMRGRFFQYGRAKVACTYHPSYLLRNPAAKKEVWKDMKILFADMGVDLDAKPR